MRIMLVWIICIYCQSVLSQMQNQRNLYFQLENGEITTTIILQDYDLQPIEIIKDFSIFSNSYFDFTNEFEMKVTAPKNFFGMDTMIVLTDQVLYPVTQIIISKFKTKLSLMNNDSLFKNCQLDLDTNEIAINNPVRDNLFIYNMKIVNVDCLVEICDLSGKICFKTNFFMGEKKHVLNLNELPPSLYIIKLIDDRNNLIFKDKLIKI